MATMRRQSSAQSKPRIGLDDLKNVKSVPLIDFQNLTVARGDRRVLRNFDLQVRRGEHIALLGPNGSGKSTLVKLITCELYPETGHRHTRFQLFGQEDWALEDVRKRIGIVVLDMLQNLSHEIISRQDPSFAVPAENKDGKISGALEIQQPEQFWAPSKFLILVRS